MEWFTDPNAWIALATLTTLEIVLGVDNIIFITVLVGRLPAEQRNTARTIGLGVAMGTRIALLLSLAWVMTLTAPLFVALGSEISGRDLILIIGGLFLLWKSTHEIDNALEGETDGHASRQTSAAATFWVIIAQIAIIDIVFSLDSVITAVGMVDEVAVMIVAIVLAVLVMMFAARSIGHFVDRHPTIKMLALSFLILVGFALIAEGVNFHVPKGYMYFAMAFSVAVEMLNMRMRTRLVRRAVVQPGAPVQLHKRLP